ncbi:hypothetical protein [Microbulbifer sp. ALW1]|uniref:hypothetical protein n=1 Tax=Microbulbifer sp. (strain ALW1) TaxID=1516059 RepID=UPI00135A794B|nr:hypothetical protein [Microbulbifer sp. ALW1]
MADNYKFVISGTDKTRAMFKSLRANLGAVRGAINSTQLKVAGLAGVAGLGALVKSSLGTQDALAKTADRLGLTTRELAAYQHQANLTGSSNEGMNKALELMNRNLGDAERGTGEAKEALADLGLTADALNRMPTAERFELLVNRLGQVSDRTRQASLAADLFGRSGGDLINMIDQGAAGLAQAKTEVDAYGVALDRVDAAKLEAANDAMFRVGQIGQGLGNQLTVHLAPIIEEVAVQFTNAASAGGGMGAMVEKAFKKGVSVVGVFADGIHGIKILFQGLVTLGQGLFAGMASGFSLVIATLNSVRNGLIEGLFWPIRKVLELLAPFNSSAATALESVEGIVDRITVKAPEGLREFAAAQREAFTESREQLHALLMTELPSEMLKSKVGQILDAADVRAQEIAAKAMQSAGLGRAANDEGDNGVGSDGLSEREREQLAAKLGTLKLSWLTELEQLQVKQDQEMALLDEAFATKLIKHDEYERSLTALEGKHAKEREKFEDKSGKNRVASVFGAFQQMLGVSDSSSKKLFKIQKGLALAKAVATLPSAVIESFNNSGGYPWGIPAATAMAATGAAQIAQIKSANFSGGGGIASVGGGSAMASPPSGGASLAGITQFASNDAAALGSQVHITIAGDLVGDSAQHIADRLTTLIAEQDLVIIPSGSRQAQELAG